MRGKSCLLPPYSRVEGISYWRVYIEAVLASQPSNTGEGRLLYCKYNFPYLAMNSEISSRNQLQQNNWAIEIGQPWPLGRSAAACGKGRMADSSWRSDSFSNKARGGGQAKISARRTKPMRIIEQVRCITANICWWILPRLTWIVLPVDKQGGRRRYCPAARWFLGFLDAGSVVWVKEVVGVTSCKARKLDWPSSSQYAQYWNWRQL